MVSEGDDHKLQKRAVLVCGIIVFIFMAFKLSLQIIIIGDD